MNKKIKINGYDERVQEAIRASGMSIQEVADKCGRKRQNFYNGTQMSIGYLMRFCSVVGCSADYILGLKREMK